MIMAGMRFFSQDFCIHMVCYKREKLFNKRDISRAVMADY